VCVCVFGFSKFFEPRKAANHVEARDERETPGVIDTKFNGRVKYMYVFYHD